MLDNEIMGKLETGDVGFKKKMTLSQVSLSCDFCLMMQELNTFQILVVLHRFWSMVFLANLKVAVLP